MSHIALLNSTIQYLTALYTTKMVVKTSLRIWAQFLCYFGLQHFSPHTPIAANHVFPLSLTDATFVAWQNLGILTFKVLFINGVFATFQQVSVKLAFPLQFLVGIYKFAVLLAVIFPLFLT